MTRYIEQYPALEEIPDITLISGGGGGEAVIPEFLDQVPGQRVAVIVGTADSGSKTGRLREIVAASDELLEEVPLPAVGDMRRLISAVSANPAASIFETRLGQEDTPETVRVKLLEMRGMVTSGNTPADYDTLRSLDRAGELTDMIMLTDGSLKGHVIGNLVLAQLFIDQRGDLGAAAVIANRMMDTRADIIPASTVPHHLVLQDKDTVHRTEGVIDDLEIQDPRNATVWLEPVRAKDEVKLNDRAEKALQAKKVALLPGSYYTTHGATVSTPGFAEAMRQNAEDGGTFAAVANLTTDRDTRGLDLESYVNGLGRMAGRAIDVIIVNDDPAGTPEDDIKVPLVYDETVAERIPAKVIAAAILDREAEVEIDENDPIPHLRSAVKTDGRKVAEALVGIAA